MVIPLLPVSDSELAAYTGERLVCVKDYGPFNRGQEYPAFRAEYSFKRSYTKRKPYYNDAKKIMEPFEHNCALFGRDLKVVVGGHEFNNDPSDTQFSLADLWEVFEKPVVKTLADEYPEAHSEMLETLEFIEMISGFKFFRGQKDFLSRVLMRDSALIAAETGTGKTLMAISAYLAKGAERCLIVCPKGVAVGGHKKAGQWISEIRKFAPHIEVFRIFNREDMEKVKALRPGIYVTYYDAFFQNQSIESPSGTDSDLDRLVGLQSNTNSTKRMDTVGTEESGIRCVAKPSMASLIGHKFDMVCLDEAHTIKGLTSQITKSTIRLSPVYRFAFTATPVPNTVEDLFPLMGWVCVKDWYMGKMNNLWPFTRWDFAQFKSKFLCTERDYTAEEMSDSKDKKIRISPIVSAPSSLTKLIRPSFGFISKTVCNEDYRRPNIIDLRVPLGTAQSSLYSHYTKIENVNYTIHGREITNPLVRYTSQIEWLRSVTTDPQRTSEVSIGAPKVETSFTPKVIAVMEIILNALRANEQIVVVNSRIGLNNILHCLLNSINVKVSRIDSSPYSNGPSESIDFKKGRTQVCLMGIKCAVGHSFDKCKNLIISSLEYSAGYFDQAKGRVDRVVSAQPNIYCVLNRNTIEEVIFDTVVAKQGSSDKIFKGSIPEPSIESVLLDNILGWDANQNTIPESVCRENWLTLTCN